jgi:hypothetical protein
MKTVRLIFLVPMLVLLVANTLSAQITPGDDAYTATSSPTANYGTAGLLNVQSAKSTIFIRFDLSGIPAGYTDTNVAKATLKLYVNSVTTAGSFNVDYVLGSWSEKTITSNLEPAIWTTSQPV